MQSLSVTNPVKFWEKSINSFLEASSMLLLLAKDTNSFQIFLESKKAIIYIQNRDNMCFGYLILYFKDKPNREYHLERPNLYTQEMFENNNLENLLYPISPSDVHLYEDKLAININVFSFFDDEGKARHRLYINSKNYGKTADLFYWDEHYATITDVEKRFSNITKHKEREHISLRCLGNFTTAEILERHQQLCTRENYMSFL